MTPTATAPPARKAGETLLSTPEAALRSYRYLLTHKHPEETKQLACVNAAMVDLAVLCQERDGLRRENQAYRDKFFPETAALHSILEQAGCVSVRKGLLTSHSAELAEMTQARNNLLEDIVRKNGENTRLEEARDVMEAQLADARVESKRRHNDFCKETTITSQLINERNTLREINGAQSLKIMRLKDELAAELAEARALLEEAMAPRPGFLDSSQLTKRIRAYFAQIPLPTKEEKAP